MNRIIGSGLLAAGILLASCTRQSPVKSGPLQSTPPDVASSEIPDRREFPVNTAAEPCEDFYEYACSIPLQRFKLREDRSRHILSLHDADERLLKQKELFLKDLAKKPSSSLSPRVLQLKDSFLACTDVENRKVEEKQTVADTVKEVNALADRAAFLEFFAQKAATAENGIISVEETANLDEPSRYDWFVGTGVLKLPKEQYADIEILSAYEALVTDFFTAIGVESAASAAKTVVDFESGVATLTPLQSSLHALAADKKYVLDIPELLKRYPFVGFDKLMGRFPQTATGRNIYPDVFSFLNRVFEQDSLVSLKHIYLFYTLFENLREGYDGFFQKKRAFLVKYLGAPPVLSPREEECTELVKTRFAKEIDAELIEKLFPDFPRQRFEKLVERVRQAIIRRLEANVWLSKEGREGALAKMRTARMQLASPASDAEWDFTEPAVYSSTAYLANARLRAQKDLDKLIHKFSGERDRKIWSMAPLEINAYYAPSDNKFIMLQGILQYPLFDPKLSDAEILGAIGMVVGHELGHGFDNNGSKYDENGVKRQWMPDSDLKEFQRRTNLLVSQFNRLQFDPFNFPDLFETKPKTPVLKAVSSVNPDYGNLTLGENIADTSGLRFAYEAAFPGNVGSLDEKRAFYLQYARVWCGTMRSGEFTKRLLSDYHAQTFFRVNEPLKHQPRFHEAYACKPGNKMYLAPEKQMDLW